MRTLALASGLTGLLLIAGQAVAQNPPPPPTPEAVEAPEPVRIERGDAVRSSDGAALGRVVGWRANAAGERELIIDGPDGIRAVPTDGVSRTGDEISIRWTHHQFMEAPTVTPPPAPPATPPMSGR